MKAALILFLFSLLASASWAQPIKVLVGGYEFPPYVIIRDKTPTGLSVEMIDLLNKSQNKYHFEFVLTSSTRRFQDILDGRFHLILFESKSWGWNPTRTETTKAFHTGGEVFITLKDGTKDQTYFDELKGKSIKGIHGYHYGFLGLSTAPKAAREYNLELTSTQDGNIQSVLMKRADVAIVPKEYLPIYFKSNPDAEKKLLVSKKYDQLYQLGAIVNPQKSPITAADLTKLIEQIQKDGLWDKVLKRDGITSENQEARPNRSSKLM
ncbi:substrate-binding periplasmic protein [Bdellovibrio sp. HCB2-146]|uniref:substrate-binding periplasmic protein n=1 Tax=Bdellovibrio sp. HCB2-146 TaxID=3394362 RepID=UPI0039BCD9D9